MRVAVVGAGISGLANALEAVKSGHEVTVLERRLRAGGNIRTEREDGYVAEWGPNGFLDNVPETFALVERLGLREGLQVSSDDARIRFLYREGALRRSPESPPAFLRSPILSPLGRARVLLEPLARSRPRHDETVHAFASRRIGREAADVLVQAMVSGVFAGDARRLSLRATFPKMFEMEREHGSLLRALMARRRAGGGGGPGGPGGTLTSFRDGMETLVEALVARLDDRVRLGCPVAGLGRDGKGYVLDEPGETADRVVLACPAWKAARVLRPLAPEAADLLDGIDGAPIAVVATAYEEREVGGPPRGFGFLAPRGEGVRILGCLWSSSIYPGARAPSGKVLLRTMAGGALDPGAVDLDDAALLDLVARELRVTMGLRADPIRHWVFRYRRGIPQYEVGHGKRLAEVGRLLAAHPGIVLAGNSYRGISVNATIQEARMLWAQSSTTFVQ
ncbi:MAG: protoporphyrinogen oxidase, partial [Planctomycetota bacterium]